MFQADFLLGPGAHSATYRCYGSFSGSRHVWTAPSDPVHLSVTGEDTHPSTSRGFNSVPRLCQRSILLDGGTSTEQGQ